MNIPFLSSVNESSIITNGLVLNLDAGNPKSIYNGQMVWKDISENGNNGTLIGNPTFSADNGGGIVTTGNGTWQPIDCGNEVTNTITNQYTIGVHFKFSILPTSHIRLIYQAGIELWYNFVSNQFVADVVIVGVGRRSTAATVIPEPETYYQSIVTYDGSYLKIYVNSVLKGTSDIITGNVDTSAGVFYLNFNPYPLTGTYCAAIMYNRALSEQEVLQHYNATKGRFESNKQHIVKDGLVLHLDASNPYSYNGGDTWFDISGNNENFTLYNNPIKESNVIAFNPPGSSYNMYARRRNSNVIKQLSSTGTIDIIFKSLSSEFNASMKGPYNRLFSISNQAGSDTNDSIVGNNDYSSYFCIARDGGENLETIGIWFKSDPSQFIPISQLFNTEQFFNIVITYELTDVIRFSYYVNSVLSNTITGASSGFPLDASVMTIGMNCFASLTATAENISAGYGSIKLYNRALSPAEILQNYNATKDRFVPDIVKDGLVLYLDAANPNSYSGTGNIWYDLSGQGNNGIFVEENGLLPVLTNNVIHFNPGEGKLYVPNTNFRTIDSTVMVVSRYTDISGGWSNRILSTNNANNWLLGHWSNWCDAYYAEGWVHQSGWPPLLDTNWRIYAGVARPSIQNSKFYINGELITSDESAGVFGPEGLAVGYIEPSRCEVGFLLAYNRALTPAEVRQNYNAMKGRFGL